MDSSRQAETYGAGSLLVHGKTVPWYLPIKEQKMNSSEDDDHGETGNRTQNLLHLTRAVKLDAKKMSYH
jgi:hypothetical protein